MLVGTQTVSCPRGAVTSDVFAALFGALQVSIKVLPYDPSSTKIGPSFHDMFIQLSKLRRLGCVAGLEVRGAEAPGLHFYAIQNPWANADIRLADADLAEVERVIWVGGGVRDVKGIAPADAWALTAEPPVN